MNPMPDADCEETSVVLVAGDVLWTRKGELYLCNLPFSSASACCVVCCLKRFDACSQHVCSSILPWCPVDRYGPGAVQYLTMVLDFTQHVFCIASFWLTLLNGKFYACQNLDALRLEPGRSTSACAMESTESSVTIILLCDARVPE